MGSLVLLDEMWGNNLLNIHLFLLMSQNVHWIYISDGLLIEDGYFASSFSLVSLPDAALTARISLLSLKMKYRDFTKFKNAYIPFSFGRLVNAIPMKSLVFS